MLNDNIYTRFDARNIYFKTISPWTHICFGWTIISAMKYVLVLYAKIVSQQLNLKELLFLDYIPSTKLIFRSFIF